MTARLWAALRAFAAVAILVGLTVRFGTDAFTGGLRAVSVGTALLALGIGLLTTAACALRWCVVARRLGLALPFRTAVADYYGGLLLNAVLPAGVLGDAHRAVSHGRRVGAIGRGVRAVVWERSAGQIVLVVLAAIALAAQPALLSALTSLLPGVLAVTALVLAAVGAGIALTVWRRPVGRWLRTARDDLRGGLLGLSALTPVALLSALAVAGHVAMFVVATRAVGLAVPLADVVALAVAALLVMAVPLNVGGWGPREAFLATAFGAVGLGAAHGLTVAVVYGVLSVIASLPGAVVLLLRTRAERGEVVPEAGDQVGQDGLALGRRGQ